MTCCTTLRRTFARCCTDGSFSAEPGTAEAHSALFSLRYPVLSLLHHHGTESDDTVYDSGNVEPRRGFGHIAFTTEDGSSLFRHSNMLFSPFTLRYRLVRSVRKLCGP